jgi:hypothetical protein
MPFWHNPHAAHGPQRKASWADSTSGPRKAQVLSEVRLNVSFGQRRDESASRRIRQVQSSAAVSKPEPEGRSPVLVMAGIAAGLMCVALLYSGYVSGMRQVGKKLDENFEAQMDYRVNPAKQLDLLKTTASDEWSLGNCTLKKPSSEADRMAQHSEGDGIADIMKENSGGLFSEEFVNKAEFLECVVNYEAPRLCQPDVRQAFAADVSVFYHNLKSISGMLMQNQAQNDPKLAEVLNSLNESHPEMAEAQNAVTNEFTGAKDKVDDALQEAISNGYVSESDFGWMTPTPVHEVFKRSKVKTAACQQHQ